MSTYYVIVTSSSGADETLQDRSRAEQRFEAIAATGKRVRLLAINGHEWSELDRRNYDSPGPKNPGPKNSD
jgi:hypothetical protein